MRRYIFTEHYTFGPWMFKVSDKYPVPKLFEPYFECENTRKEAAELIVKVPRNLERRQVKVTDDLYQYLIVFYDDHMDILEKSGETFEEVSIMYDRIEAIERYEKLLKATLSIYANSKKFTIEYNSVSENIVMEMIELMRSRYVPERKKMKNKDIDIPKEIDTVNRSHLKQMKEKFSYEILTYQNDFNHAVPTKGILNKELNSKVQPHVYVKTNQELIILNSGKKIKKIGEIEYGSSQLYIPMDKIKYLKEELKMDDKYIRLSIFTDGFEFLNYFQNIKEIKEKIDELICMMG